MSDVVQLMTTSRLTDARACQRLHDMKYRQLYRPAVTADALRFGSLFHRGLEALWRAWVAGEASTDGIAAALAGEADPFERAKAEELLRGYALRWAEQPYDILAVEQEFNVPMVNPATGVPSRTWRLAGKIDAIVRDRHDGRVLIVEHKTSSEAITPGSEYWKRLRMDGQVSIYYAGARALGHDVAACLYDVVGKPGIRPLKVNSKRKVDETPDEYRARLVEDIAGDPAGYYQRGEVVRLEAEMDEAMHDVWQTSRQIREAELATRFPRNPDACVRYGRTCPFFGVCTGEASLEDPSLFTKSVVAHPELTADKPANDPKEEDSDGSHKHSSSTSA